MGATLKIMAWWQAIILSIDDLVRYDKCGAWVAWHHVCYLGESFWPVWKIGHVTLAANSVTPILVSYLYVKSLQLHLQMSDSYHSKT